LTNSVTNCIVQNRVSFGVRDHLQTEEIR
jgi:hypothetical protein